MTITNAELRNQTAEFIRKKAVDQDLADEDASKIDTALTQVLAELTEDALVWWATDAIPLQCVFAMKQILGAQIAPLFGKAGYEGGEAMGRARLSKLKPSGEIETLRTLYY